MLRIAKIKPKKGALPFAVILVVMMVFILIYAWLQLSSKYNTFNKNIGEKQYELINVYQRAEKALYYVDQSAKYSLQQAVYSFAQNGGFLEIEDVEEIDTSGTSELDKTKNTCGKVKGVNIWFEIKKDSGKNIKNSCFDEKSLTTNLEYVFNKNLNDYLSNHPTGLLIDNYNYEIRNSLEIAGKAIAPLKFDILKDETKKVVKEAVETPGGLVDFTGTELCKKGKKCLLTKEAYDLLLKSQEIAKQKKVSLEVTSGYRTLEEQNILWKRNPDSRYVCPPSQTCPHLTGNAVDIRIKEKTDWPLLHKIMSEAGWVRYRREAWHFECCNTIRYTKAKELEKKIGKPVTIIA